MKYVYDDANRLAALLYEDGASRSLANYDQQLLEIKDSLEKYTQTTFISFRGTQVTEVGMDFNSSRRDLRQQTEKAISLPCHGLDSIVKTPTVWSIFVTTVARCVRKHISYC